MKKHLILIFITFVCATLSAQYTGQTIGPDVAELDGRKLQWEAGSYDYFVMFKSLITNNIRTLCSQITDESESFGCDWDNQPEGDTCLPSSTFSLDASKLPEDAYVEAAYLVWSASVDPMMFTQPTNNNATLTFTSADGLVTYSENISASRQGTLGTMTNQGTQDFTFEGIGIEDGGSIQAGHYSYRVDITDFFRTVHEKGLEAGYGSDGLSLVGDYTVSNVACSDDPRYISRVQSPYIVSSGVIGGWSIIMVYRSIQIDPKMVYIYNGFSAYKFQQQDIKVSGFEFPDKPKIKVTLHMLEGDPGISVASDTNCGDGGGLFGAPCPPEGLSVTGETTDPMDLVILQNNCNPAMFTDMQGTAFNFSETYNSISSIYGWNSIDPICVGGDPNNPNPDTLEYTMDVDTFVMDTETDALFNNQFKKGDKNMYFKIGANGDYIYTNFMVVSVDTKAPRYDIPPNADTPSGREKFHCSCSEKADSVCFTAPFYFTVKIQNWGDDISTDVTIQDKLSPKVTYVPGTTEICKEWKEANVCSKWTKIEDGAGGAFPLTEPYTVTDVLMYCDPTTMECPETIMVRFKVLPKDNLQKHDVIENTAIINDSTNKPYKSNTSIPLRLVSGTCPSAAECENPDLTECGGVPGEGCEKNEDCADGEICNSNGQCVTDTSKFTENAKISVAIGKNSPVNSSSILVPAPSTGLVMGQVSVIAEGTDAQFFNFNSMSVKVNKDAYTIFSNLKLVYDENGNGKVDNSETVIAEPNGVDDISVSFANKKGSTTYKASVLHHFLMVADVTYQTPDDIPLNNAFNFEVDAVEAFDFSDAGTPVVTVESVPMEFVEYSFEPTTESFIFTKGPIDPPVPAISEMNKTVEVMQIRTKALKHSNTLEKIRLKTTSKSVYFGDGINGINIYADSNGDGSYALEKVLATGSISNSGPLLELTFTPALNYAENEEKLLLIVANFKIPQDKMAQIEILSGKVTLDKDVEVLGLPLKSKEFWYKCEAGDLSCQSGGVDEEDSGCAISTIDEHSFYSVFIILSALLSVLFFAGRKETF